VSADGPLATPAVGDGRIFTISGRGELHALRLADGAALWQHDLVAEFGAKPGFLASSPLLVRDRLIVLAGGGDGKSVVALSPDDGKPSGPRSRTRSIADRRRSPCSTVSSRLWLLARNASSPSACRMESSYGRLRRGSIHGRRPSRSATTASSSPCASSIWSSKSSTVAIVGTCRRSGSTPT
jgi:hypothetical protein